jgi:hypothetical protein
LGERFLGTLVIDGQGKFMGLLDPGPFDERSAQLRELIDSINAADVSIGLIRDRVLDSVRRRLEEVRRGATASVTETTTLASSLRDKLWNSLAPDQPIAVLSDDQQFSGVTTRQRLIGAVGDAGG